MKRFITGLIFFAMATLCFGEVQPNTIITLDDMESATDWIDTGQGTNVLNTSLYHSGDGAVTFATDSDSTMNHHNASYNVTLKTGLGFWINIDDVSLLRSFLVFCYADSGGSSDYKLATVFDRDQRPDKTYYPFESGKWCYVWLPYYAFDGGSLSWDASLNLRYLKFRIRRVEGGGDVAMTIDDIVYDAPTKGGAVIFFDSARDSTLDIALPMLRSRGYKAAAGVIVASVGIDSFLSTTDIGQLYDAGWDIVNHSTTHPDMDSYVSEQGVRQEIGTCKKYLIDNGFFRGSDIFIWPGNTGDPSDLITAADADAETFTISRAEDVRTMYPVGSTFDVYESTGNDGNYTVTGVAYSDPITTITVDDVPDGTDDGSISPWYGTDIVKEYSAMTRGSSISSLARRRRSGNSVGASWRPKDWHQIPYFVVAENYSSPKTWADDYETAAQAIIDRGCVFVVYMHEILAAGGGDNTDVTPTILNDMLTWMKQQEAVGNLEVMTPSSWLGGGTSSSETFKLERFWDLSRIRYYGGSIFRKNP